MKIDQEKQAVTPAYRLRYFDFNMFIKSSVNSPDSFAFCASSLADFATFIFDVVTILICL